MRIIGAIFAVLLLASPLYADSGSFLLDARIIMWSTAIISGEMKITVYEKGQHIASLTTTDMNKDIKSYIIQKLNRPVEVPQKQWSTLEVTEVLRAKGYMDSKTEFSADMPIAIISK
jgi:hypothetical protein